MRGRYSDTVVGVPVGKQEVRVLVNLTGEVVELGAVWVKDPLLCFSDFSSIL